MGACPCAPHGENAGCEPDRNRRACRAHHRPFLIAHYKGQIVIPDLGFYGRDIHASLVRENRLIAGVYFLNELPDQLRKSVLLIRDKKASGAIFEDAELLAKCKGLRPDPLHADNAYERAVRPAMA